MEERKFCKEQHDKRKNYEKDIEREKIVQCQMALEREHIANGMQCTKLHEVHHKQMLKMQMEEKKLMEAERERVDIMWHRLLLDTVKMKEQYEIQEAKRLNQERTERRLFYDKQIANANKIKKESIKQEREVENRRLDRMKKKLQEDHYEEIKRKKDQQQRNKINYIDGHRDKLMRIGNVKKQDRELDNKMIKTALEEMTREKQQIKSKMQTQRIEERVFVDNCNRERGMAEKLQQETENLIAEWERQKQEETQVKIINAELQNVERKKNATLEYRKHLDQIKQELERDRLERSERMERVKKTAYAELRRNLDNANEEMKRQIQYRNNLTGQIKENQKVLEAELNTIETKQRPFTKQAVMFKEAMTDKLDSSRVSTNPVHPFRRLLQTQSVEMDSKFILPAIHNHV